MAHVEVPIGSLRTLHRSVLLLTTGILLAAVLMSPASEAVRLFGYEVPVLCGWRRLTGEACPGCGMTRSFTFMAHGLFLEAFRVHPAGPLAFLLVATQPPWRVFQLWRLRRREGVTIGAGRANVADQ